MAERSADQLTLRELFTNGERLVRELTDHLEQSFVPKVQELERVVRPLGNKKDERAPAADSVVREKAAAVLSSDDFAQTLYRKLNEHLAAIERGAERAISTS